MSCGVLSKNIYSLLSGDEDMLLGLLFSSYLSDLLHFKSTFYVSVRGSLLFTRDKKEINS